MLSVGELLEDRDDMDCDMPVPPSCEWIERIDRGGILHHNDDAYATFVAMEEGLETTSMLARCWI